MYARFKDNILAADLAEITLLSSKKVLHDFIEIVNKSKDKLNKLWVDQVR